MALNVKVVLFEDTPQTQSEILAALKRHLEPGDAIHLFDHQLFTESDEDRKRMYEDRLESILRRSPYDGTTLILADRDLSKSVAADFTGLSVNAVIAASKRLFVPICSYARQAEAEDYDWRGRWEEGHIILRLSSDDDELARRAVLAARGFARIAAALPAVVHESVNDSPAKMLAALLGKPEYADKIALYSVGDQNRLPEVPKEGKQAEQLVQRLKVFLGYWLWDSLLRYPGVFVNKVAAASYLNLAPAAFDDTKVQALFEEALYHGPFEDTKRPQWWRGMLDDIIASADSDNGLDLVRKKVDPDANPSQCCEDPLKTAGYYCIISDQPVSSENSKGGLSWFPRGADLTRISTSKFEEYGPWLGA
jgi:hypothetical protein